jgi:hypothetical protein
MFCVHHGNPILIESKSMFRFALFEVKFKQAISIVPVEMLVVFTQLYVSFITRIHQFEQIIVRLFMEGISYSPQLERRMRHLYFHSLLNVHD